MQMLHMGVGRMNDTKKQKQKMSITHTTADGIGRTTRVCARHGQWR